MLVFYVYQFKYHSFVLCIHKHKYPNPVKYKIMFTTLNITLLFYAYTFKNILIQPSIKLITLNITLLFSVYTSKNIQIQPSIKLYKIEDVICYSKTT